jgi:hypothetical protein
MTVISPAPETLPGPANQAERDLIADSYRAQIAHIKKQLEILDFSTNHPWRPVPLYPKGHDVPVRIANVAGLYRAVLALWRFDSALESRLLMKRYPYVEEIFQNLVWYVAGLLGKREEEREVVSGKMDEETLEHERRVLTEKWCEGMGMLLRFMLPRKFGLF